MAEAHYDNLTTAATDRSEAVIVLGIARATPRQWLMTHWIMRRALLALQLKMCANMQTIWIAVKLRAIAMCALTSQLTLKHFIASLLKTHNDFFFFFVCVTHLWFKEEFAINFIFSARTLAFGLDCVTICHPMQYLRSAFCLGSPSVA